MKPEKIKEQLAKLSADDYSETLGCLARNLGHELPKNDLKVMDESRSILSGATLPGRYVRNLLSEDGYIKGYLAALVDVAAAYSAAITSEADYKEAVDLLCEFGYKPLALALLQEETGTAKSLSVYLLTEAAYSSPEEEVKALKDYSLEAVEYNLAVLCSGQLAECFGEPPAYYRLTLRGEVIANMLKAENNQSDLVLQKEKGNVEE